jgi:hypothetical protein
MMPLLPFMVADRGAVEVQLTTPVTTSVKAFASTDNRLGATAAATKPRTVIVGR